MPASLTTERLRLDPWDAQEHAGFLAALVAQPGVMRFVGDGRVLDRAGVSERASFASAHWLARGWGWRVAHSRTDDVPVAIIAANRLGEGNRGLAADEFELGWSVDPGHQRRGYAVEAAGAVLGELLGRVRAPSVLARIQGANTGSIRVAEALAMIHDGDTTGRFGEPMRVYRRRAGA